MRQMLRSHRRAKVNFNSQRNPVVVLGLAASAIHPSFKGAKQTQLNPICRIRLHSYIKSTWNVVVLSSKRFPFQKEDLWAKLRKTMKIHKETRMKVIKLQINQKRKSKVEFNWFVNLRLWNEFIFIQNLIMMWAWCASLDHCARIQL